MGLGFADPTALMPLSSRFEFSTPFPVLSPEALPGPLLGLEGLRILRFGVQDLGVMQGFKGLRVCMV